MWFGLIYVRSNTEQMCMYTKQGATENRAAKNYPVNRMLAWFQPMALLPFKLHFPRTMSVNYFTILIHALYLVEARALCILYVAAFDIINNNSNIKEGKKKKNASFATFAS